jgi:hypothetical protein
MKKKLSRAAVIAALVVVPGGLLVLGFLGLRKFFREVPEVAPKPVIGVIDISEDGDAYFV